MNTRGKTEHSGAKHGKGAFRGAKQDAKKFSNRHRRINGKAEIRDERGRQT